MEDFYKAMSFLKFQFHKGAIRTYDGYSKRCNFTNFNSIKVRLERVPRLPCVPLPPFQFHKGAIRTD